MMTPFAIDLYEQYLAGKTPERLAFENGIPVERIELRLRVAADVVERLLSEECN